MSPLQVQRTIDLMYERSECLLADAENVLKENGYKSIEDRRNNLRDDEETTLMLNQILELVQEYAKR